MAEIIGYDKKVFKRYKGICPHCGAIVIFDEKELHHIFQYNEYCFSKGECPGCLQDVTLNRNKDQYESVAEFYSRSKSASCKRNCTKCQVRCLYRKEDYIENDKA